MSEYTGFRLHTHIPSCAFTTCEACEGVPEPDFSIVLAYAGPFTRPVTARSGPDVDDEP